MELGGECEIEIGIGIGTELGEKTGMKEQWVNGRERIQFVEFVDLERARSGERVESNCTAYQSLAHITDDDDQQKPSQQQSLRAIQSLIEAPWAKSLVVA